ncbi:endoglucanase 6 [Artemisia annua]|uniref:Endoglucanase 6 n=1 Tax=Artemisia annua TaxID=35608 RepID=A0A2U1K9A5_ARTAN|nr:endoglucanase 6 [Artemisia annua]
MYKATNNKYAGVQTLVAKLLMGGKAGRHAPVFGKYQQKAEFFMCSCVGKSNHNVQKTPGGSFSGKDGTICSLSQVHHSSSLSTLIT